MVEKLQATISSATRTKEGTKQEATLSADALGLLQTSDGKQAELAGGLAKIARFGRGGREGSRCNVSSVAAGAKQAVQFRGAAERRGTELQRAMMGRARERQRAQCGKKARREIPAPPSPLPASWQDGDTLMVLLPEAE